MSAPLERGLAVVREAPGLVLAQLAALAGPAILGLVPLDRVLAPLMDLRPAARALIAAPLDDALLGELHLAQPAIAGSALGGALVALLLAVPACWLIAAFVAARAQSSALPPRIVAGRGIGVALVALPLRAIAPAAAALLFFLGRDARTLATYVPWLAAGVVTYALVATIVTICVDLARGAAIADADATLPDALLAGLRAGLRAPALALLLVLAELAIAGASVLALAVTRPLGVFHGWTLVVGIAALALRAVGTVAIVATAATGAASRSA